MVQFGLPQETNERDVHAVLSEIDPYIHYARRVRTWVDGRQEAVDVVLELEAPVQTDTWCTLPRVRGGLEPARMYKDFVTIDTSTGDHHRTRIFYDGREELVEVIPEQEVVQVTQLHLPRKHNNIVGVWWQRRPVNQVSPGSYLDEWLEDQHRRSADYIDELLDRGRSSTPPEYRHLLLESGIYSHIRSNRMIEGRLVHSTAVVSRRSQQEKDPRLSIQFLLSSPRLAATQPPQDYSDVYNPRPQRSTSRAVDCLESIAGAMEMQTNSWLQRNVFGGFPYPMIADTLTWRI